MTKQCNFCGRMVRKYRIYKGSVICFEPDCIAVILEEYLLSIEKRRKRDKPYNKQSFQQAREMSAWLSIYRFGNAAAKAYAAKVLQAWL